jgi:hypothetical protein
VSLPLRLALMAAVAGVLVLGLARPAGAVTHISGTTYNSNTTWTASGSPYVIDGNVTVASGVTLTVDPGVIVKFNGTFRTLTVDGTLDAEGTSGSRITFTSIQDDAIGGDTGGDGATSGSAGQWYHLTVDGTATLDYADVRFGGWGFANYTNGAVWLTGGGSVSIDHSTVYESETSGVLAGNGGSSSPWPHATINHSTLSYNDTGAAINNGTLTIGGNSSIVNNTNDGLWFSLTYAFGGTATTVVRSTVTGNGGRGVYYQPNTGISSSVEPTGNYDNIYSNGTGKQLVDTMYEPLLDWTNNYWASGTTIYGNDDYCQANFPDSPDHLAFSSSLSLPPDGPVDWDPVTLVDPQQQRHYCGLDQVDVVPRATSLIDNSGY